MSEVVTVDDILAHHGVKGMHWGVRKALNSDRSASIRKSIGTYAVNRRERAANGGMGSVIAKKVVNSQIDNGASWVGGFVGGAAGTAILGPAGTAGGALVGNIAGTMVSKIARNQITNQRIKSYNGDFKKMVPGRHKDYTDNMVKADVKKFDVDGARRINKDMVAGVGRNKAVSRERSLQRKASLIGNGINFATNITRVYGPTKVKDLKNNGSTKAYDWASKNGPGARRAARNAPNSTQIAAKQFAKKNRKGVYNITSLK